MEMFCASCLPVCICSPPLFPLISALGGDQYVLNNLISLSSFCWIPPTGQWQETGELWGKGLLFPWLLFCWVTSGWLHSITKCSSSYLLVLPLELFILCLVITPFLCSVWSSSGNCSQLLLSPWHCTITCWFLNLPHQPTGL